MRQIALCLIILLLGQGFSFSQTQIDQTKAIEIINRLKANFLQISDAVVDVTLDYNVSFFGCSGKRQLKGKGYYQAPDRIKVTLNDITYFARGNKIRKRDEKGGKWYVQLINALNFTPGFHPGLINYNFDLSIVEETPDQITIKGIPKKGIMKNVKSVLFYIDPKENLLRKLDVKFVNEKLPGKIKISYQKIKGLWVPVKLEGESAIVVARTFLVGINLKLTGKNMQINNRLPPALFEPGF